MDRAALEAYIREQYGTEPDHPWLNHPTYAVFRHGGNRKWFAVVMDVARSKLGLPGEAEMAVVNFKCDPVLLGSLLGEPGFFPAYHMSKASWVTAALDGSAAADTLKLLLDRSFAATAPKPRRKRP